MDTAVTRCKRHLYFIFPMTHEEWKKKRHKKNPSIFIRNCPSKLYDIYTIKKARKKKSMVKNVNQLSFIR